MNHIVFSHGNSFPASTYRVMLDSLRARGWGVSAIEMYGHDPRHPVTDGWPHLVQQLAEFAAQQKAARGGQAPCLVGHSLGGILSLMCAAQHPELAQAVVLLDSPVVSGWRARGLGLAKREQQIKGLQRENSALRDWADQPLPDMARRLREQYAAGRAAGRADRDRLPAAGRDRQPAPAEAAPAGVVQGARPADPDRFDAAADVAVTGERTAAVARILIAAAREGRCVKIVDTPDDSR